MFKKIFNKIIMGTKCYILLKERCNVLEKENESLREHSKMQICEQIAKVKDKEDYIEYLQKLLSENKKNARRIIREINKMNNEMAKEYCREIIKQ